MAGILSGKHAGFLSEEIISEDMNIEAVDGDLLAEELEQAQEQLFAEQEKFNIAIEAECETEETKQEIMEALESDINDVVYAKLLVNKLSKNNTLFYGDSKPLTSGLESDRNSNAKTILTAGLEDAKGMLGSIKEFIAKVWQKIKDAFAWVWKKMKDFWAWLTGASKKAEEKKEETVVAAAGVNAATAKSKEIIAIAQTSSYVDPEYIKRSDEAVKRYKARKEKLKDIKENPSKYDYKDTVVSSGKFKGQKLGDLSFKELQEIMEGKDQAIIEAVNDIMTEEIIIEEVAKTTGLSEEKVASYISPAMMKNMKVFAFEPKLADKILEIINENIALKIKKSEFKHDMDSKLMQIAFVQTSTYGATAGNGFAIKELKPNSMFSDFQKWIDGNKNSLTSKVEEYMLGKDSFVSDSNVGRSNALMSFLLKAFVFREDRGIPSMETVLANYALSMKATINDFTNIVNNLDGIMNRHYEKDKGKLDTINILGPGRTDSLNLFLPVEYNSSTNTGRYFTVLGDYEIKFTDNKISDALEFTKQDLERFAGLDIGSDVSKTKSEKITNLGKANMIRTQESVEHMLKIIETSLNNTRSNSDKYKDDSDWKKMQSNLIKIAGRASLLNVKGPRDLMVYTTAMGMTVISMLDIPGAIAQASKEFDSSKFKFDKK